MFGKKKKKKLNKRTQKWKYIQKMWNYKIASVVPIVFRAFGAVTKNLMMWVTKIGTPGILNLLQKACLLGTAKILRRTLGDRKQFDDLGIRDPRYNQWCAI